MARRVSGLLVGLRAGLAGLGLLAHATGCSGTGEPSADRDVAMHVERVAIDANHVPVVVLEESDGSRVLPIWIGSAEARSIATQIEERPTQRPNSHDLARRLIERLDGEVVHVVVTELRGGTYYALMSLRSNGEIHEVDSRPSDAIAIALRTGAPIFARESLLDASHESDDEVGPGQEI